MTLGPEDFVLDDQLAGHMATALMRSQHKAAELAATAKLKEELHDAQLREALLLSMLPPVVDLVSDE